MKELSDYKRFYARSKFWRGCVTGLFGLLTLATFFMPSAWAVDSVWFNVFRFAVMLIFIALILSYKIKIDLAQSFREAPKSAKILMIIIPLLVLLVAIVQVMWPGFATWLIRCDNMQTCGWNFRHAIFIKAAFELIAMIIFASLLVRFAKQRQFLPAVTAGFFVLLLLFMAGEELSWGQRIFDFATPAAVASLNAQHEFNIHDMATQVFQNAWYFGCWLLLVALPFLREPLQKLLAKSHRFGFLGVWLPPSYFILIFGAIFGLVDPLAASTGVHFGSILFMILGTAVILAYLVVPARGHLAEQICLTLGVFLVALFFNLFVSQVWQQNSGAPTEYLETFLTFGILLWALYLRKNLLAKK